MEQLSFIADPTPQDDAEIEALREIAELAWKYETTSEARYRQKLKNNLIAYRARWKHKKSKAKPHEHDHRPV